MKYLLHKLKQVISSDFGDIELSSTTVVYDFHRLFDFTQLADSTHNYFYEKELFPALQISCWLPIHVHLFESGKAVFTGVKRFEDLYPIVEKLKVYLI